MGLSLVKQQDKVKLSLKKVIRGENVPPVQMVFLTDVSGSMQSYYREDGFMNSVLQRSIALASIIDPDKVVQIVAFSNDAYSLGDFGVDAFENICKSFLNDRRFWGGTVYSSAFNEVLNTRQEVQESVKAVKKGFFKNLFSKTAEVVVANTNTKKEAQLILFYTDGQNDPADNREFQKAVDAVADDNTYVLFVGAGGAPTWYSTLKQIADDKDNVGFIYLDDPKSLSDEDFYDIVLSGEFGEWVQKFEVPEVPEHNS